MLPAPPARRLKLSCVKTKVSVQMQISIAVVGNTEATAGGNNG